MSENSLRTKITDLPLCEDTDLIDTLIAIGKDGKTYRVNSEDVLTKKDTLSTTTCLSMAYNFTGMTRGKGTITIPLKDNPTINFYNLIKTGGILHITVNVDYTNIDVCILFDEDCMFQVSSYSGAPIFAIDQDYFFTKKITEGSDLFTRTIVKPKIINISDNVYVAHLNDTEKAGLGFTIKVIDLSTMELDDEAVVFVSNVYFEPKTIPPSKNLTNPV